MNIKWMAVPALAFLTLAPGAIKARAYQGQPLPAVTQDQDRWSEPPSEYREAERRGFHEGVEAARQDYTDHRHADADDHELYKHPPVEESLRRDFREGFKEGYRRAMDHMKHDRDDDRPHF